MPGFIDAHVHFTGVGEAARNLKLGTAKNWDEIVRMVGDAAKKAKPGEWIIGRGWHQEKWSEVPTANVAIAKNVFADDDMPTLNMWCAQTPKLRKPMAMVAWTLSVRRAGSTPP